MQQTPLVVRPLTLTENELHFYRQQGYLTIPGLLAPEVVEPLREQVLDVLEANGISRAQMDHASATADKLRQNPQYLAGSLLDTLINGAQTLALAGQLIGGRAVRYLPFTAVKAGGGGGQFHFHQDNTSVPSM